MRRVQARFDLIQAQSQDLFAVRGQPNVGGNLQGQGTEGSGDQDGPDTLSVFFRMADQAVHAEPGEHGSGETIDHAHAAVGGDTEEGEIVDAVEQGQASGDAQR